MTNCCFSPSLLSERFLRNVIITFPRGKEKIIAENVSFLPRSRDTMESERCLTWGVHENAREQRNLNYDKSDATIIVEDISTFELVSRSHSLVENP